jgi:hypothetical protein
LPPLGRNAIQSKRGQATLPDLQLLLIERSILYISASQP